MTRYGLRARAAVGARTSRLRPWWDPARRTQWRSRVGTRSCCSSCRTQCGACRLAEAAGRHRADGEEPGPGGRDKGSEFVKGRGFFRARRPQVPGMKSLRRAGRPEIDQLGEDVGQIPPARHRRALPSRPANRCGPSFPRPRHVRRTTLSCDRGRANGCSAPVSRCATATSPRSWADRCR